MSGKKNVSKKMHRLPIAACLCIVLAGCSASVGLGVPFDEGHQTVGAESGKVIVYRYDALHAGLYHDISFGSAPDQRVAKGGFYVSELPPGPILISAFPHWVGDSAKTALFGSMGAQHALPLDAPVSETLIIAAGEIVYLRLNSAPEEYTFECEVTKNTARLCTGVRQVTVLENIAPEDAVSELDELREVCDEC